VRSALVLAGLTLTRLMRGRAVWVSVIIAGLPLAFAFALRTYGQKSNIALDVLVFENLVLALLPAMFVAASVGEDIEDRTTTYLWSRPVPRWAVLVGKLLALAPVTAAFMVGSWIAAVVIGSRAVPPVLSTIAIGAGSIVVCFVSAGIATLVPKHGMALTISYMLFFDLPVGLMPISLSELSVTHHVRQLAGMFPDIGGDPPSGGAIGLVALAIVWMSIALWRFRKLEA
jgi:ABC-type transport system involved in multi-copper enzyme maturation permease subunit